MVWCYSYSVKALYPSLDIDHTADIVAEEFFKSEYQVQEVDTTELSLYLAVNMKPKEIEEEKIKEYCHTRKRSKGAPPKITGCAIDNNLAKNVFLYLTFKKWVKVN